MKKFYDTSSILTDCSDLSDVVISSKTIEELENIKTSSAKDADVKYKARVAVRAIKEQSLEVVVVTETDYNTLIDIGLEASNDNLIIACAKRYSENNPIEFYTEDYLCEIVARCFFFLTVKSVGDKSDEIYKGYKVVYPTDEELSQIYAKDNAENIFGCGVNEYVVVKDKDENVCDVLKWTGEKYAALNTKSFKSRALGTLKPLDEYQRMAFDSIVNNDLTVLFGKVGSGKTTIPLSYIMQSLESGKYRKCYIVHSYDTLKGQKTLGYIKGDTITKMLETGSLGNILSTKLGDSTEVERYIASGQFEIIPTANLRGVEIADSICYCTESQNLDNYTLKTLIQRCKSGSKIILEGDVLSQCDTNRGSGLFKLIDVFKGYKSFGCVKLKNNYRSEISDLADKL